MKRPIKFRVWNSLNNKFIYSDKRDLETQLFRLFDFLKEMQVLGNYDVCLQQFTGLLDTDGKEIYEGDIFQGFDEMGGELKGKIQFINSEFLIVESGFGNVGINRWNKNGKVIGNIFENPELMIR